MNFSSASELVWGAIIVSMTILRVVWIANGRGFVNSFMEFARWERPVYLAAMAGVTILYALEHPGILAWVIATLPVAISVGLAVRTFREKPKPVESPVANRDAQSDSG
jgi:hypothetical protein